MNVASYIDHTILKPTTVLDDVQKLCDEAVNISLQRCVYLLRL